MNELIDIYPLELPQPNAHWVMLDASLLIGILLVFVAILLVTAWLVTRKGARILSKLQALKSAQDSAVNYWQLSSCLEQILRKDLSKSMDKTLLESAQNQLTHLQALACQLEINANIERNWQEDWQATLVIARKLIAQQRRQTLQSWRKKWSWSKH